MYNVIIVDIPGNLLYKALFNLPGRGNQKVDKTTNIDIEQAITTQTHLLSPKTTPEPLNIVL